MMTTQNVLEGSRAGVTLDWCSASKLIDHTLLNADATRSEVSALCSEAATYGLHAVMVNAANVAQCVRELRGSEVVVGSVVGFPLGATTSGTKLAETLEVLKLGALEVDMVINLGALKSGERDLVRSEMQTIAQLCHDHGAILKAILEMGLLSTEEKLLACQLASAAEVDFVKTSTGFTQPGATVNDIHLMRGVVGAGIGVKASGGIRTAHDFLSMIEAGANRVGASSSVAIVRELGAPAL